MKLWIILYLVLILNISCQSVGTVEDLTSKTVNTEMESKTPDSKDSVEKPKASNSQNTEMVSKTPVSKDSIKQTKSSNSKNPASITKNHKPGDPKS